MPESDSSSASDERRSDWDVNEARQECQMLLAEARTTANQQLAQINKLDDEAVRTVRMAFVFSGLLLGGAKFLGLPTLGLLEALGVMSLLGSLILGLFVYGTSNLFMGPSPDALPTDWERQSDTPAVRAEVFDRYERGLVRNRRILASNSFILGIARLLLAGAIVLFASGFALHVVPR